MNSFANDSSFNIDVENPQISQIETTNAIYYQSSEPDSQCNEISPSHLTVLITTSGVGERLGKHTKYTNKSLIKVGDKYAICHIIEQYDANTKFVITLGHYGNYVKEFLDMAYPDKQFEYVRIDNFQGPGSSLGYSMLQARLYLQCPFIFHCCDAIVTEPISIQTGSNTLYVASVKSNLQYASIISDANQVKELNNKGHCEFDYAYTGISYIHDFTTFWSNLESIYLQNPFNMNLSDVHVIQKMICDGSRFKYIVLNHWYDTGNISSYYALKTVFGSKYIVLEKDNESVCFINNKVIKFINDPEINAKRVLRGISLFPYSPKITNSSSNFFQMELVDGVVLSDVTKHTIVRDLLQWAKQYLWTNKHADIKYVDSCKRFYIDKTIHRLNALPFLHNELECINGLKCKPVFELINDIALHQICTDTFCQFHGDFVLDNIIYSTSMEFKLIDWRHEFDGNVTHGDVYYDLAKLRHNLILNHKNVHNGLFELTYMSDGSVVVDLKCNYFHWLQLRDYDIFIKENGFDAKKIEILTALIWLNMAPLYDGTFREFLFYFGKYNLALTTIQL